jgi:1-acyl-sn-glycerol-3-phosphate acyltransferase
MLASLRRKHPGSPVTRILFYEFGRALVWTLAILLFRFRWFGARHVPADGPLLIVANHQSHLDAPLIGAPITQRQLDYVARAGLYQSRVLAWIMAALNATPIKEQGSDTRAIKDVLARLEQGRAVFIFPEGSRSPDGSVAEFKRGVAVIVKRSRCPVVPVAIEGAFDAWPRTESLPRWFGGRIAVMYGRPIGHDELLRDGAEAALERLHAEIDAMRLRLRAKLRAESDGRYPAPGKGDPVKVSRCQGEVSRCQGVEVSSEEAPAAAPSTP